jgi:hypothetical protein
MRTPVPITSSAEQIFSYSFLRMRIKSFKKLICVLLLLLLLLLFLKALFSFKKAIGISRIINFNAYWDIGLVQVNPLHCQ